MIPDPYVQPWAYVRVGDFLNCSAEGVPEIQYFWDAHGRIEEKDIIVCGLFLKHYSSFNKHEFLGIECET